MAIALADIYCWIKTIAQDTGKSLPDGYVFLVPQNVAAKVIVRYSVANDSHKPAGPLTVVGTLFRNGVRVKPGGQPNVVPSQTITVQPGTVWVKEYTLSDNGPGTSLYEAKLYGDLINVVNEEDEGNNLAKRTFERRESF